MKGFHPSVPVSKETTRTPPHPLSLTQQRRLCYGTARALDREHTHDRKHSGRCRGESLLEHTLWQKQHETTSHPQKPAEAARNHLKPPPHTHTSLLAQTNDRSDSHTRPQTSFRFTPQARAYSLSPTPTVARARLAFFKRSTHHRAA